MVAQVVTAEEVSALMQGLPVEPDPPHPERAGAASLRPGQRVALALDVPTLRRRAPGPWHTVPRPIESLTFQSIAARLPESSAYRLPVRPLKRVRATTDFWPAYADALTNVVLHLLLLIGLVTMGLVVLNREVVDQQLRLAAQRAKAAQSAELPPPPSQPEPEAPTTIASAQEAATSTLQGGLSTPGGPSQSETNRRALEAGEGVQAPESRQRKFTLQSPVATGVPTFGDSTPEVAAERFAGLARPSGAPVRFALKLTFDLRETSWPEDRAVDGAELLDPLERRALVAFAPKDNRRLMTEAFSRLMSVRNRMIASGVPAANIVLRLAPVPADIEGDVAAGRTVYVINLGRE